VLVQLYMHLNDLIDFSQMTTLVERSTIFYI